MPRPVTAALLSLLAIPPAASGLRLEEAVTGALEANPAMKAQAARVEAARVELKRSRIFLPSDPALELEHETDGPYQGSGERVLGWRLSQELSLGKRTPRVNAATALLEAAEADLAQARRQLARDVRAAFFDLLAAQAAEGLAGEALRLNEELARAAENRLLAGDISTLERDLARTDLQAATADVKAAQMRRRRAEVALGRLMGVPGREVTVEGDVPRLPEGLDPEEIVRAATTARPDLHASAAEVRAAESRRDLARRGYVPDPELSLYVVRERGVLAGDDFRGDPAIVSGIHDVADEDVLAGLSLGIRLPVTGHVRAEIAAREAALEEQRAILAAASTDAAAEILTALAAAAEADATVRAYEQLLPSVEANLRLLTRAYDAGQISLADYLLQKDRSLELRRTLLEAESALAVALADLDLAAGVDLVFRQPPSRARATARDP